MMITCPQCLKQYALDSKIRQRLMEGGAGHHSPARKFFCAQCHHMWLVPLEEPSTTAFLQQDLPPSDFSRDFLLQMGEEPKPHSFFSAFLDWIYTYKIDWLLLVLGLLMASGILYHERFSLSKVIPSFEKLFSLSTSKDSPFIVQNIRFEERRSESGIPQIIVIGEVVNRSEKVHSIPTIKIIAYGAIPSKTAFEKTKTSSSTTPLKGEIVSWHHRLDRAVLYPNERLPFRAEATNSQEIPIQAVEAVFTPLLDSSEKK